METQQYFFIIFDTSEGAFILYDIKDGLKAFTTEQEARDLFELNYKEKYERKKGDWNASVVMHWVNLKPFVIGLPANLEPLEALTILSNSNQPDLGIYCISSSVVRKIHGLKVDLQTCRGYQVSEIRVISPEWWPQEDTETASKSS